MNLIIEWFEWHFFERTKFYFRAFFNICSFLIDYFSTKDLIKSLFSPWKRISVEYPKSFDIQKTFEAFFFNIFSRLFGAVFRIGFIFFGILVELIAIIVGLIIYLILFFMPVLIIFLFFIGLNYLWR